MKNIVAAAIVGGCLIIAALIVAGLPSQQNAGVVDPYYWMVPHTPAPLIVQPAPTPTCPGFPTGCYMPIN